MKLKIRDRVGLVVYLDSFRQAAILKRYGNLTYVSKRMDYVILYVDRDRLNSVKKRLARLNSVKKVYDSSLARLSKELANRTAKESQNEGD